MRKRRQTPAKRASYVDKLSDDVIRERWSTLRPKAFKGTLLFLVAAIVLFAYNHFFAPAGLPLAVVAVAFQVACVFGVCGAFLLLTCQVYGRSPKKTAPSNSAS